MNPNLFGLWPPHERPLSRFRWVFRDLTGAPVGSVCGVCTTKYKSSRVQGPTLNPRFPATLQLSLSNKAPKKIFKERSLGQTSEIVSFYFQLFDFQKWGERIQQFSEKVVFLHSWTDTFTAVKWPECFFQREVIDRVWRRLSRPAQLGCITSSLWTLRLLAAELCSLYLLQIDPVDKLFFQKISRVNEAVVSNA